MALNARPELPVHAFDPAIMCAGDCMRTGTLKPSRHARAARDAGSISSGGARGWRCRRKWSRGAGEGAAERCRDLGAWTLLSASFGSVDTPVREVWDCGEPSPLFFARPADHVGARDRVGAVAPPSRPEPAHREVRSRRCQCRSRGRKHFQRPRKGSLDFTPNERASRRGRGSQRGAGIVAGLCVHKPTVQGKDRFHRDLHAVRSAIHFRRQSAVGTVWVGQRVHANLVSLSPSARRRRRGLRRVPGCRRGQIRRG